MGFVRMTRGAGKQRMPMVQKSYQQLWTDDVRERFLTHLAQTCNVTASLRAAGRKNPAGLYALRRRDAQFRAAWDEALAQGYARLEAELLDRALNGRRVRTERDGVVVETIEYSDTLGLNLLAQHRRAVADYRAAVAGLGPREDVTVLRTRIVEQIMTIVDALPEREADPALALLPDANA